MDSGPVNFVKRSKNNDLRANKKYNNIKEKQVKNW